MAKKNYFTDILGDKKPYNDPTNILKNAFDWETILATYVSNGTCKTKQTTEEALAMYVELLNASGEWAANALEPRAKELDQVGSGTLKNGRFFESEPLLKTIAEAKSLGFFSVCGSEAFGGSGVPMSVGFMAFNHLTRACMSTSAQLGFYTLFADMIERFAPKEFHQKFIPHIYEGTISGSMCLTEPNVGSDLGNIKSKALKQADGTYLITGSKRFISSAGGGLGLILAKTENAKPGLEGISLFFAEQFPNGFPQSDDEAEIDKKTNYYVTKLEEKMGMHGAATCEVNYDNTVAHLIGEEGGGFKIMLHLMNEARISVGIQGIAICEAALDRILQYAETREAFGHPLKKLPLYSRNLQDLETELSAFRIFMFDTISNYDLYQALDLKKHRGLELTEEEKVIYKEVKVITRHRTPLSKYYGSEMGARFTQKGIQALGGYGFMKEYEVERLHRDSQGPLLYEGTSQIQALMACKDLIKDWVSNPSSLVEGFSFASAKTRKLSFMNGANTKRPAKSAKVIKIQQEAARFENELKRDLARLLFKTIWTGVSNVGMSMESLKKLANKDYWLEADRWTPFLVHAETVTQALSLAAILESIAFYAEKDESACELFDRFYRIAYTQMQALSADWKFA